MSRTFGDRGDKDNKIRLLKRQIDSLKRENARLSRELSKAQDTVDDLLETDESDPHENKQVRKQGEDRTCSDCRKGTYNVLTVPVRGGGEKTYLTCNVCQHRVVKK